MTLNEKLIEIKTELIHIPKKDIIKEGVDTKLGRAQRHYEQAIEKNCKYILSRDNYKAMIAIARYTKKKERLNDEEEIKYGFVETI